MGARRTSARVFDIDVNLQYLGEGDVGDVGEYLGEVGECWAGAENDDQRGDGAS